MNVFLISAHDDNASFVAALQYSALSVFERAGHRVSVTDLHAQQFNPVAGKMDFSTNSADHANYMFNQLRASNTGSGFSPDIDAEMQKLKDADLVIFHFPLWWSSVPAVMKGWMDRVLANGFAYGPDNKYGNGLMRGKKALVVTSVGDPESFYSPEGVHKASVMQHLYWLTHGTLALCGFDVLKPQVIHNITAAAQEDLEKALEEYRQRLTNIESDESYIYKHASDA